MPYIRPVSRKLQFLRTRTHLLTIFVLVGFIGSQLTGERTTRSDSTSASADVRIQSGDSRQALTGDSAIEHLKDQGTYQSLQEAMAAVRYEAKWQTAPKLKDLGAAHELSNRANNLLAYVTTEGIEATSLDAAATPWRLGLKLRGYGYGDDLSPVTSGEVTSKGNRVSIKKSAIGNPQSTIEEWYVNSARGIEQGFTISSPPESAIRNPQSAIDRLRLRMAVTGDLQAAANDAGSGVIFKREADNVLVSYEKLFVTDAKGRAVAARMKLEGGGLVIEVDDEEAEYPLTIDPLLRELTKLTAADGESGDEFGTSVAISGDTVVVGAPGDDFGEGLAYVLVRSGTTWTFQQQLTHSDGQDSFGTSVAISGETVVVGAPFDDVGANTDQGSAYVYVRSGTTWTQQAQLTASDGAAFDRFGESVAISGDTAVVGASVDDVGANFDQGSAYVYVRSGTTWTQQQQLTVSDGAVNDLFGVSVAISGDTAVVGANFDDVGANSNQGSAFVFVRSGTTWTQQAQLTASDGAASDRFGDSVAISGDTAVVGASTDNVGAIFNQGSASVFVRSGTTWTQQQQLTASDGAADDRFGTSVAISGATIVVGAPNDDVGNPVNTDQGSAYLFVCNWTEQPQLTASDGASPDNFGSSVALSNDTAVIGAIRHTVSAAQQGAVFVFVRIGSNWSFQQKLVASDAAASDLFGASVAISGNTIVVGAEFDDVSGNSNQGSAYVFTRSGITWTQQQQLFASDGAASDQFGGTVAISGDIIVVGAALDDVVANNQGSAYVFTRSGTTWTQQQQLTASDGAASDQFGISVAISGDTAVVGAELDDVGANVNQGSAYVFVRSGTTWTQQQQLTASDGAVGDRFGGSVAISGDTIVVGAPDDDVGANANQGSANVFTRSGASWSQQQQLFASDGAANDRFGITIANYGDTILVGANLDDVGANADQGSAYVFMRSGLTWFEQQHLTASDGAASDDYGISVALNGNTILVGAEFDDIGANANQGSAYIYVLGCNTVPTAAANNVIRQKGSPTSTATIANVNDTEDPIGYLSVTVASTPTGITITGITNTNGVITASIAAACNATLGNNTVVLQVQDSDGGVTTATMLINVTANTLPTLGAYNDTSVLATNSVNVTPSVAPSDNGWIVEFSATSATFAGILGAEPDSGVISISNARPAGNHIITVTAIDNCGATISSGFILTVTCQSITVNPPAIPSGTAGSPYNQVFTQTGGNAPVSFALIGTLPTGLSFTVGTATLSGTPTQVGSFPITVTATDVNNCSGSRNYTLTINAPMLVWNGGTSSNWHTPANWSPAQAPTTFHNVLIPNAGVTNQPTVASSSSINAMTMESSRVLTINASQQLSTAADITTSGTITGSGKLLFDGATFTQNGSVSVASVEFDSGAHALTGGGAFASGIITVLNGASVTLTSAHSLSVIVINGGGVFDASGQTLTLTGAGTPIFNSGSFIATGSTIIYQGSVAQVVTANIDYTNLTANNAAGLSLAGDTTVNGLLTLTTDLATGSFILTMPNTATSAGDGDVVGNVKRLGFVSGGGALSFGNPLNTIRINSGTAPSDITVNLVKSAPAGFSNTVTRTYTVTPNGGGGISATMRLRYRDSEATGLNESTFELWRFTGASWVSPAGSATRDTTQNWVEESGITTFSPWTIAGPSGPTFIELISFSATTYDDGTLIEWQTGLEVDNLGFNVYREQDGRRSLVNSQLVAGSALFVGSNTRLGSGNTYAWWDDEIADCGSRIADCGNVSYWLEDVDLKGQSTLHGPFYSLRKAGSPDSAAQNAKTLAQLSSVQWESLPVEYRASSAAGGSTAAGHLQLIAESRGAIKLRVKHEAWYRVSGRELTATGMTPDVDARDLQLFVDGKQQAIRVTGEEDGRLDPDDSIEFYGVGIESAFTDLRTYYLVAGKSAGLRVPRIESPAHPSPGGSFESTVERRDRLIYFAALRNGDNENFFGSVISGQPIDQSITLKHLAPSVANGTLSVALQGVTNVQHLVTVMLNGASVGQLAFQGQAREETSFSISSSLLREGDNRVTLASQGGPSDVSLVDHIRVRYQRSFAADDNVLKLAAGAGQQLTIVGFTSPEIQVFDVTDPLAIQEIAGFISKEGTGTLSVSLIAPSGNGQRLLLALTRERGSPVAAIFEDEASTLRNTAQGADLIIISSREVIGSLDPLIAQRVRQGLLVMTVDVEDIYDEFSFGNKTPYAVREFLRYTQSQWKKKPRFVLFAGDASYDPKNYLGLGAGDCVPTKLVDTSYMETASDDWFADFDGDGVADLAAGRLPVCTSEELSLMVSKIIASEKSSPSQELTLVADETDGFDFEAANNQLASLVPTTIRVTQVNRGRVDTETAKKILLDGIHRGQKLVNYTGHGSVNQWRGNLLDAAAARVLVNERLPVFVLMTCLNGYFHDAAVDSLAEALLKAEHGGAVAVWASSGMTLPMEQALLNQELYRQLFNQTRAVTLGEAVMRAKSSIGDPDIRRTWILLGDPTTKFR